MTTRESSVYVIRRRKIKAPDLWLQLIDDWKKGHTVKVLAATQEKKEKKT
jgi:hypothetical protein